MDEATLKKMIADALSEDFHLEPEVSGFTSKGFRVRADFIAIPLDHVLDLGFPPTSVVIEVKGDAAQHGGLPWQTYAQCADYVDGLFIRNGADRAWCPKLGFVCSGAMQVWRPGGSCSDEYYQGLIQGLLRSHQKMRVGTLTLGVDGHRYRFFIGDKENIIRRHEQRGLLFRQNLAVGGLKAGNRGRLRETFT